MRTTRAKSSATAAVMSAMLSCSVLVSAILAQPHPANAHTAWRTPPPTPTLAALETTIRKLGIPVGAMQGSGNNR